MNWRAPTWRHNEVSRGTLRRILSIENSGEFIPEQMDVHFPLEDADLLEPDASCLTIETLDSKEGKVFNFMLNRAYDAIK